MIPLLVSSREEQCNTVFSCNLPINKYFNFTITACNGYGNASTSFIISKSTLLNLIKLFKSPPFFLGTFDVIDVFVNISSPTELTCIYNPGSLARGCLVYLKNTATGITYCKEVYRLVNEPVNMSLCLMFSTGLLSAAVYSVEVYAIENDGSVAPVPAITEKNLTVTEHAPMTIEVTPLTSLPPNISVELSPMVLGKDKTNDRD